MYSASSLLPFQRDAFCTVNYYYILSTVTFMILVSTTRSTLLRSPFCPLCLKGKISLTTQNGSFKCNWTTTIHFHRLMKKMPSKFATNFIEFGHWQYMQTEKLAHYFLDFIQRQLRQKFVHEERQPARSPMLQAEGYRIIKAHQKPKRHTVWEKPRLHSWDR